ncbi:nucleoside diphosphate kinase 3-like [Olea europaea subsp. europaea]|uniref:Nucleoside diphosphate kinase n=1 Tax=Olea europaea subsp. europaea TaxID=158383 RepID=A0A8S0S1Y1_OLEEU|nr:nucleoside diphosphate kinase 3-like [Olea europaea subsp. europaea]
MRSQFADLRGLFSPLLLSRLLVPFRGSYDNDEVPDEYRTSSRGRSAAAAATVSCRGRASSLASSGASESGNKYRSWIAGAIALPSAGATDPHKSEPGTIRGDLAVVVGRNIIHGSDGLEIAKDGIKMWFKPEELISYMSNAGKWIYGDN